MDLQISPQGLQLQEQLRSFMDEFVLPAESLFEEQILEAGDPHHHPPIMVELKEKARARGLWNLFLPDERWGAGLSNVDYAYLAETMGRSRIASEAFNCNAPDTGNMETLVQFATPEQEERWLKPLLDGKIRSGFAMTEPDVASSDATNIELSMVSEGDDYVLNGRKWWTTNALHPNCKVLLVMGKSNPDGPPHKRHSVILVPIDTPGLKIVRSLPVFGFQDQGGHAEIEFDSVRVPKSNLLAEDGDGFRIGQARLGPGRIHHCMRLIGITERALELMCRRAASRTTFGKPLSERDNIRDWIADARIEIEMVRLLCLKAAWQMDKVGARAARVEIAAIKIAAARMATTVLDRAIQVYGGGGVSNDVPLARMYAYARTIRLADGPDEVHRRTIASHELRRWESSE